MFLLVIYPMGAKEEIRKVVQETKTVATPQDNIIEALEVEIVRLKAQLSNTEDRLSKMQEKINEMAIKLYGGRRN